MRNLKNVLAMALVTGMAFGASTDAFAQRRDHNDRPHRPGHQRPHRPNDQYEVESAFIGKTLENEKLFLGRELGLRMEQGKEIEEVTLQVDGMRRGGTMYLMINGRDVSQPQDFRGGRVGEQTITFKLHRPFIIGDNAQRVQVDVVGAAYIESASILLKKEQRGRPQPNSIEAHPHEYVFGTETLDLARLASADYRQEQREVRIVELEIESFDRAAQIRLCKKDDFSFRTDFNIGRGINVGIGFGRDRDRRRDNHSLNCQNTQLIQGRGTQHIRLFANGDKLEDLELLARGSMTIKKVTIRFER